MTDEKTLTDKERKRLLKLLQPLTDLDLSRQSDTALDLMYFGWKLAHDGRASDE